MKLNRYERRHQGAIKDSVSVYLDNKGDEYQYKWIAQMASFFNVFFGCLKNGFPVVVPRLWYPAWAFYPFFFIDKNLKVADPIAVLNHERIHIRQQRELHIFVSIPLIVLSLWFPSLLVLVPFVPTIFYMINWVWEFLRYLFSESSDGNDNFVLSEIRENTCFERESMSRATNAQYLGYRKPFAFIAYLGIKRFQNYGIR